MIKITNTTAIEMARLYYNFQTLLDQGVMNVRNGKAILHFDETGKYRLDECQSNVRLSRMQRAGKPL